MSKPLRLISALTRVEWLDAIFWSCIVTLAAGGQDLGLGMGNRLKALCTPTQWIDAGRRLCVCFGSFATLACLGADKVGDECGESSVCVWFKKVTSQVAAMQPLETRARELTHAICTARLKSGTATGEVGLKLSEAKLQLRTPQASARATAASALVPEDRDTGDQGSARGSLRAVSNEPRGSISLSPGLLW